MTSYMWQSREYVFQFIASYTLTLTQRMQFMHTSVSPKLAVHVSCSISPRAEPEERTWLPVVYWRDDPRKQE